MGATTPRAKLNYNTPITAKELNIVFNGVVYENVPRIEDADKGEIYYGSATFIEYPFELLVESNLDGIWLYTTTSGEYTISASIPSSTEITTTPCFDKARGYECKEETTLLTDESVTTVTEDGFTSGTLAYSTPIDADTIKVTFNGTEYTCDKVPVDENVAYGGAGEQGPDFSEYPFAIMSSSAPDVNVIYTETAGTHQVKIEVVDETIKTTECFKKAVAEATKPLVLNINNNTLDKTFAEIKDAYLSGRTVLLDPVNQTPILREASGKSYYSITEMIVMKAGGDLKFGAELIQSFHASTDDAYPTRIQNQQTHFVTEARHL